MTQSSWSLRRLRTLLRREVAAEATVTTAQTEWRDAWWATTWYLAAVPRNEWGEAMEQYVAETGHSQSYAKDRRRVGGCFTESRLASTFRPAPRMAKVAVEGLGRNPSDTAVAEMLLRLRQAETEEMSLREFSQAITGRPWTSAPENLTEADEDAVVERVIRKRPDDVAATLVERAPESIATAAETPSVARIRTRRAIDRWERSGGRDAADRIIETAREADEQYRSTVSGTADPDAQAVLDMVANLVQRDVARGTGGNDADYTGALNLLVSMATRVRDQRTGTVSPFTADDRAILAELGVML